ncbi:DUF1272 domain-containing protein [Nocardia shimofusensis]|uniref:DUF1272 domain-containing protein n=1 Tax=Nocardia shimofusensis TaxID=228596 RepID=UPI0009FEF78C|nr:DUF1272 domain-containing protein [Nocardia shimofusensis]
MLRMKTRCELCATTLTPDAAAWICSYECTYCPRCHTDLTECPNCAGELAPRPRRTTGLTDIAAGTPARLTRIIRRSIKSRS